MKKHQSHRREVVTFFSVLLFTVPGTQAIVQAQQSTSTSTSDSSLTELKERLAELNVLADIRKAEKAILDSSLPKATTQSIDGKTTITQGTNITFESEILAYQSLQRTIGALAKEIREVKDLRSIVVFDETAFKNVATYQSYFYLYENLRKEYAVEAGEESVPNLTAIEIPTRVLGSVADLSALFRTEKTINNFSITLGEEALVAQLAKQLQANTSRSIKVLYPKQYSPDSDIIFDQLRELYRLKKKVEQQNPKPDPAKKAQLDTLASRLKEIVDTVSKPDMLYTISRSAIAAKTLTTEGSYVLVLRPPEGGGSTLTTRNLFFGSRTRHSGGAIVHYILFNTLGEIAASNTLYHHTGYVRVRRDQAITNLQNTDQK